MKTTYLASRRAILGACLLPLCLAAQAAPDDAAASAPGGASAPAPAPTPARAPVPARDDLSRIRSAELNLIRGLVEQGILPRDKAAAMLQKAGMDTALLDFPGSGPTSVPGAAVEQGKAAEAAPAPQALIPPRDRQEILDQVRDDVRAQAQAEGRANPAALPPWLQRISFGGDLRLRYIRNDFASDNTAIAQQVDAWYQLPFGSTQNSIDSHELLELRGRLDLTAQIDEGLQAGLRLETAGGNDATASPVDYDVQLGRFGRPISAAVGLAYLQWDPRPDLRLSGGRMANAYFKSDLIFAPELSLDGIAAQYRPRLAGGWGAFANVGVHALQTNQSGIFNSASEQWLYAVQAGADWQSHDATRVRLAAGYFDFAGIEGRPDPLNSAGNTPNDASAPAFRQFGNTMFDLHYQVTDSKGNALAPLYAYAGRFRLLNFGGEVEFARFDPLRLALQVDWVRNVGFHTAEIEQRIGGALAGLPYPVDSNGVQLKIHGVPSNGVTDARTNGYLVHLRMGAAELREAGNWQLFGGVRYLQRDAVPDAFTSPDYRLGGTDNQSAYLGLNLALSPATSITLRRIAARSIDSQPKFAVDTWFLDLYGRF